jgi:hypothetical protein
MSNTLLLISSVSENYTAWCRGGIYPNSPLNRAVEVLNGAINCQYGPDEPQHFHSYRIHSIFTPAGEPDRKQDIVPNYIDKETNNGPFFSGFL